MTPYSLDFLCMYAGCLRHLEEGILRNVFKQINNNNLSVCLGVWLCGSLLQCDHRLEHFLFLPVLSVSSAMERMSDQEEWDTCQ